MPRIFHRFSGKSLTPPHFCKIPPSGSDTVLPTPVRAMVSDPEGLTPLAAIIPYQLERYGVGLARSDPMEHSREHERFRPPHRSEPARRGHHGVGSAVGGASRRSVPPVPSRRPCRRGSASGAVR